VTTGIRGRARAELSDPLMRGAYSLMANTVLASLLGVVFWIAAARLYPASQVGRDSALIATMMTLSGICQLNMVNAIPRFLPQVRDPARTLRIAYLASAGAALVLATGFVLIVPHLVDELRALADEPLLRVAFVIATVLWGVFGIQDAALAAFRRAPWVPVENAVFGLLKLIALPLLLVVGAGYGVFQSWVLPMALLTVPVNVFLFRSVIPAHRRQHSATRSPLSEGRRPLVGFLARDYAATALSLAAVTALPLLVLSLVGSSENAYFFIALTIVTSLELLAFNAGTAVIVESAFAEERLQAHARTIVRRLLPIMLGGAAVIVIGAPLLLSPFGADYAEGGSTLLRLLGTAVIFRCTIALFQVIARARRRGSVLLAVDAAIFVLLMGLTTALAPRFGLTGVGVAWLAANGVIALAVLPGLVAFMRRSPETAGARKAVRRSPVRRGDDDEPMSDRPLPSPRELGPTGGVTSPSLTVLIAAATACVSALVLIGLGIMPSASALALVGVFSLAPGAALLPLLGGRGDGLRIGPIIGVSLGVSVLLAQTMLWVGAWEPRPAALLLSAACLPVVALHLAKALTVSRPGVRS
jgi:O-antigen/teichoic acid export membrane protein